MKTKFKKFYKIKINFMNNIKLFQIMKMYCKKKYKLLKKKRNL